MFNTYVLNEWMNLPAEFFSSPVWKSPAGCLPCAQVGLSTTVSLWPLTALVPKPGLLLLPRRAWWLQLLLTSPRTSELYQHACFPVSHNNTLGAVLPTVSQLSLLCLWLAQTIYGAEQKNVFKPSASIQYIRIPATKISCLNLKLKMSLF